MRVICWPFVCQDSGGGRSGREWRRLKLWGCHVVLGSEWAIAAWLPPPHVIHLWRDIGKHWYETLWNAPFATNTNILFLENRTVISYLLTEVSQTPRNSDAEKATTQDLKRPKSCDIRFERSVYVKHFEKVGATRNDSRRLRFILSSRTKRIYCGCLATFDDETKIIWCSYRLLQFQGIIWRHSLRVSCPTTTWGDMWGCGV